MLKWKVHSLWSQLLLFFLYQGQLLRCGCRMRHRGSSTCHNQRSNRKWHHSQHDVWHNLDRPQFHWRVKEFCLAGWFSAWFYHWCLAIQGITQMQTVWKWKNGIYMRAMQENGLTLGADILLTMCAACLPQILVHKKKRWARYYSNVPVYCLNFLQWNQMNLKARKQPYPALTS